MVGLLLIGIACGFALGFCGGLIWMWFEFDRAVAVHPASKARYEAKVERIKRTLGRRA